MFCEKIYPKNRKGKTKINIEIPLGDDHEVRLVRMILQGLALQQ